MHRIMTGIAGPAEIVSKYEIKFYRENFARFSYEIDGEI